MLPPDIPKTGPKAAKSLAALTREDRLKAALKANMGRRKAQARARHDASAAQAADDANQKENE